MKSKSTSESDYRYSSRQPVVATRGEPYLVGKKHHIRMQAMNMNLLSTPEQQRWLLAYQSFHNNNKKSAAASSLRIDSSLRPRNNTTNVAITASTHVSFDEDDLLLRRILDDAHDTETHNPLENSANYVVSPLPLQLQRQKSEESFFAFQSQSSARRLFAVTDERFRLLKQESEPSILARRLLVVQQCREVIHNETTDYADGNTDNAATGEEQGANVQRNPCRHRKHKSTRRRQTLENTPKEKRHETVVVATTTATTVNKASNTDETRSKSLYRKKEKLGQKQQQRRGPEIPLRGVVSMQDHYHHHPPPRHYHPLSTGEKARITFDDMHPAARHKATFASRDQKHTLESPPAILFYDENLVEHRLERQQGKSPRRESIKMRSRKEEPLQIGELEQKHHRSSIATKRPTFTIDASRTNVFRKPNHKVLESQLETPMKESAFKYQLKKQARKESSNRQRLSISAIGEELVKNQHGIRYRISNSLRNSSHWLVDDTEEEPPPVPIRNIFCQESTTKLNIVN